MKPDDGTTLTQLTEQDLSAWSVMADAEEKNRRLGGANWPMIVRSLVAEVRRLRKGNENGT